MQGNHVQAIQQVFAKAAFAHHLFKVEVGGSQDTYIGTSGNRVADAFIFLVLDETQQFGLQGQREIADLVEEQCAPVSLADPPQGAFAGAGEGAAGVAE
ncbi:hypothetical protein D9M73_216380 [compost metagenome]